MARLAVSLIACCQLAACATTGGKISLAATAVGAVGFARSFNLDFYSTYTNYPNNTQASVFAVGTLVAALTGIAFEVANLAMYDEPRTKHATVAPRPPKRHPLDCPTVATVVDLVDEAERTRLRDDPALAACAPPSTPLDCPTVTAVLGHVGVADRAKLRGDPALAACVSPPPPPHPLDCPTVTAVLDHVDEAEQARLRADRALAACAPPPPGPPSLDVATALAIATKLATRRGFHVESRFMTTRFDDRARYWVFDWHAPTEVTVIVVTEAGIATGRECSLAEAELDVCAEARVVNDH